MTSCQDRENEIARKLYEYKPTFVESVCILELEHMAAAMQDQDDPRLSFAISVLRRRARHIREGDPTQNPFLPNCSEPWEICSVHDAVNRKDNDV